MVNTPHFLKKKHFIGFAHRGANYLAPENTVEAFSLAVKLGFNYLETDVRASKDGIPFIMHDSNLLRMTGENFNINKLTSKDLATIKVKGESLIPKLQDIFEMFPEQNFNIDAKSKEVTEPLAEVIRKMNKFDHICIGSFSDRRIALTLKALNRHVCHSCGVAGSLKYLFYSKMNKKPQRFTANCVQLPLYYNNYKIITEELISFTQKMGMKLHVWTINNEQAMNDLIRIGVNGIMSDNCQLLKKVMTDNIVW